MTSGFDDPGEMLDAYLDGLLDRPVRERFEGLVKTRPELRQELERQRAIDASLHRALRPASEARMRAIVEEACRAHEASARSGSSRWRFAPSVRAPAIAAALALCATGAWLLWSTFAPRDMQGVTTYVPLPPQTMTEVYASALATGFVPDVICDDADEFEMWFQHRFHRPLRLRDPLPEGVAALGLGYSNSVSPSTIHLLGEAEGTKLMVFIDRVERPSDWEPGEGSGLHLYRTTVGDLALFELSPLDEPRMLRHFYDPGG